MDANTPKINPLFVSACLWSIARKLEAIGWRRRPGESDRAFVARIVTPGARESARAAVVDVEFSRN